MLRTFCSKQERACSYKGSSITGLQLRRSTVTAVRPMRATVAPVASDVETPILLSAVKASVYRVFQNLAGLADFDRPKRAALIDEVFRTPDPDIQAPLLSDDFVLEVRCPSWKTPPLRTLTKPEYLGFLRGALAAIPNWHLGCMPTDGLRDADGSVLIFLKPYGSHKGSAYPPPTGNGSGNGGGAPSASKDVQQPSGRHFIMPLTEVKVWAGPATQEPASSKLVVTKMVVLSAVSRCPFTQEGVLETLQAAALRGEVPGYTTLKSLAED